MRIPTKIRRIAIEVPLGVAESLPEEWVANFENLRTISKANLTERMRALGYAPGWEELTKPKINS